VNLLHLPDRTRVNDGDHLLVDRVRVNLNPHLRDEPLLRRDLGEAAGLVDGLRQRLLAVDVQPALHGRHGDRAVHVIGRRDVHRVQVALAFQELPVVGVDAAVGEALLHLRQPVLVHLAHRDELEVRAGG